MKSKFLLRSYLRVSFGLVSIFLGVGCAIAHHVQVGEVDSRVEKGESWVPFSLMVSETGVNVEEIGRIARATQTNAGKNVEGIAEIVALFQQGPRTGNPVYNERYAERVVYQIHEKCPSGRITGIVSVRETNKYPVISGEIVRVSGYCRTSRTQASNGENK